MEGLQTAGGAKGAKKEEGPSIGARIRPKSFCETLEEAIERERRARMAAPPSLPGPFADLSGLGCRKKDARGEDAGKKASDPMKAGVRDGESGGRDFGPLVELLSRSFLGEELGELSGLDGFDFKVAVVIMRRKSGVKQRECEKVGGDSQESFLELLRTQGSLSCKRVEENHKFVFKHTLKALRAKFKLERPGPWEEFAFYRHFFQPLLDSDASLQLEDFLDPLDRRGRPSKTLSSRYLSLIFRSGLFREAFEEFLARPSIEKSPLVLEYLPSVRPKLEKLFSAWEKNFRKSPDPLRTQGDLLRHLEKNHQCKLPWTRNEVLNAIQVFLDVVRADQPNPAKKAPISFSLSSSQNSKSLLS